VNKIWNSLEIEFILIDDLWIKIAIPANKYLLVLDTCLEKNTSYHLSVAAGFEINENRFAANLLAIHDQKYYILIVVIIISIVYFTF
jgi:hypothetical protein